MTRSFLLGVCVVLASGCATTAATSTSVATPSTTSASLFDSPLRDSDGHPLPAYALEDINQPLVEIRCADGRDYHIAFDREGELYSPGNRKTYRAVRPTSDQTICNRILDFTTPR